MNWLAVTAIGIILLFTFIGYWKGFIRLTFSLVSFILTIALVSAINPYISGFLKEHTPIHGAIKQNCLETLKTEAAADSDSLSQLLGGLLGNGDETGLLEVLGVNDYIAEYIADMVLDAVSFMATLFLITIIIRLLFFWLRIFSRLPVIKGLNKYAGAFVGFAEGLLIIWVAMIVITIFFHDANGRELLRLINESNLLTFLYKNNVLLKLIL